MLRTRRAWKLTRAEWLALPSDERDELLADDFRRQQAIDRLLADLKDAKAMDLGWFVALALAKL